MYEPYMNPSLQIHIFTKAMEGSFVGNRCKQFQSAVVKESNVPEVCLLQWLPTQRHQRLTSLGFVAGVWTPRFYANF